MLFANHEGDCLVIQRLEDKAFAVLKLGQSPEDEIKVAAHESGGENIVGAFHHRYEDARTFSVQLHDRVGQQMCRGRKKGADRNTPANPKS